MKYRASFHNVNVTVRTRWYPTKKEAQDALRKRIGHFHDLGMVCGDPFIDGHCTCAPRDAERLNQRGLVDLETNQ